MRELDQLSAWVAGWSFHDREHDQCCPDFSCCRPELLAPLKTRRLFAQRFRMGDDATTMAMLSSFLGNALAEAGPAVHICTPTDKGSETLQ